MPRTPLGRLAAIVLAVVGIPLNLIMALQLGRLLCTRLPRLLPVLAPAAAKQAVAVSEADPNTKQRATCSTCWPASGKVELVEAAARESESHRRVGEDARGYPLGKSCVCTLSPVILRKFYLPSSDIIE